MRQWFLMFAGVVLLTGQWAGAAELSSRAKKAEGLIAADDRPGAVAIYKELAAKDSLKSPALVIEGREGLARCMLLDAADASNKRSYDDAEKILKDVLATYKDTAAAAEAGSSLARQRSERGALLFTAGKYDECAVFARETLAMLPVESSGRGDASGLIGRSLYAAASRAMQAAEYDKALSYCVALEQERLSKDDPSVKKSAELEIKIGAALLERAQAGIKDGQFEAAVTDAELALKAGGDDAVTAQILFTAGKASRLGGQPDKAIAYFRKAVEGYKTTPFAPEAAYESYLIYRAQGKPAEALEAITTAANLNVDNMEFLFIRAGLLRETGAADESDRAYRRLVELTQAQIQKTYTNKEKLQNLLGQVFLNTGEYDEASIEFEKAIVRKPDYTEARQGLAQARFKEKDFAAAAEQYGVLIKQADAEIARLGSVARGTTTVEDADRRLEGLRSQVASFHFQNGLCWEQVGDLDSAERECRLGLESVPTKEAAATMKRIQKARGVARAATPTVPSANTERDIPPHATSAVKEQPSVDIQPSDTPTK